MRENDECSVAVSSRAPEIKVVRVLALALAFAAFAAQPGTAEDCRPEKTEGPVTVESCEIDGTGFRLIRAETVVQGSIPSAIAMLEDAEACPEWQAICEEERATALEQPFQSLRHRVSGKGIGRRVTIVHSGWLRTSDGRVINDIAGADDLTPDFEGTRVLCMRLRWILTSGDEEGTLKVVQETVADPQLPLGLGPMIANRRTVTAMMETFTNFGPQLGDARYASGPDSASLPLVEEELPDLGEEFVACQAARQ